LRAPGLEASATVFVVPRAELLRRAGERRLHEPLHGTTRTYAAEQWKTILEAVDLEGAYRSWIAFLASCRIPFEMLESTGGDWRRIGSPAEMTAFLRGRT